MEKAWDLTPEKNSCSCHANWYQVHSDIAAEITREVAAGIAKDMADAISNRTEYPHGLLSDTELKKEKESMPPSNS